ncbi:uncharacterized protein LOC129306324 isoform X2 [Prosopis cineraria]|uniref:uncharacterized protein LOC129306324 isoform X2 n=1 Tax=Prosopis cineraria TaxID=364024 RepID=UPI00240FFE03|nr:uncharacterized protein LOC129306324 isoform X2 [Prosopis cineraria]
MEDDVYCVVPCSSLAVESIIRVGTAGAIWGLCSGPYDARKQGFTGLRQASFVVRLTPSVDTGFNVDLWLEFLALLDVGFRDTGIGMIGCSRCCWDKKLDAGNWDGLFGFSFQCCR